jgi:SOS response regulatory protein OraA/RecX
MRLVEFADAEEQLALWKLVSDHMWKAIAQQAEQQAAERAEKARQAKLKPKAPKARVSEFLCKRDFGQFG